MKFRRLITVSLACGAALSGTACQLFQKKDAAAATDPYGQAPAYGYGAGTGTAGYEQQPAANPYGQPAAGGAYGGYQPPATGGYSQPAAGGYDGGYTAPAPSYSGGASSGGGRSYTVVKGDNLFRIARQNNVSVDSLMRANNITNPNLIQAGQRLTIP